MKPDEEQSQNQGLASQNQTQSQATGSMYDRFKAEVQAIVNSYHDQGLVAEELADALEELKDDVPEDPEEEVEDNTGDD